MNQELQIPTKVVVNQHNYLLKLGICCMIQTTAVPTLKRKPQESPLNELLSVYRPKRQVFFYNSQPNMYFLILFLNYFFIFFLFRMYRYSLNDVKVGKQIFSLSFCAPSLSHCLFTSCSHFRNKEEVTVPLILT